MNPTGANGLSRDLRGDRLFPLAGGSAPAHRADVADRAMGARVAALGTVLRRGEPLISGIERARGQKGYGGRLMVPEGVWDFGPNGLTIAADGLEIIALSPGKTVFRRLLGSSASTFVTYSGTDVKYGVLTITGTLVRVSGITFEDSTGTAEAVVMAGAFGRVERCRFTNCYIAATVAESDACAFTDNLIVVNRHTTVSFRSLGSCSRLMVSGNLDQSGGSRGFSFGDGCTDSTVTGNVLDSSGYVTLPTGSAANEAAGNVAEVNEQGAYTLANNTAVAADVPGMTTWPVSTTTSVHMRYQISRGGTPDVEAGTLMLAINGATCAVLAASTNTGTAPGVTFSGVVSGGSAKLQYTTTNTGANATLTILDSVTG